MNWNATSRKNQQNKPTYFTSFYKFYSIDFMDSSEMFHFYVCDAQVLIHCK